MIRLRQAVDHPYLVIHSAARARANHNARMIGTTVESTAVTLPTLNTALTSPDAEDIMCGVCHESLEMPVKNDTCLHEFCKECILQYVVSCPEGKEWIHLLQYL